MKRIGRSGRAIQWWDFVRRLRMEEEEEEEEW
jgi:hypothetical protein